MPWIEGRLLDRLIQGCPDGSAAASLHPFEGLQPFPLVCHRDMLRTAGALLNRKERSLRDLLRTARARLVRVDDPMLWGSFANINTIAQYQEVSNGATFSS